MKKMAKIVGTTLVAAFATIGVVCTTIIMGVMIKELKEEEKMYKEWQK